MDYEADISLYKRNRYIQVCRDNVLARYIGIQ